MLRLRASVKLPARDPPICALMFAAAAPALILPRAGFAYQWNDKMVVRGGFGLFAGFLGERRGDVIQPGYTRTTTVAQILERDDFSKRMAAEEPISVS